MTCSTSNVGAAAGTRFCEGFLKLPFVVASVMLLASTREGVRVGPWRTEWVGWQPALAGGVGGAIPLSGRLHIVASVRVNLFQHDPGGGSGTSRYGLAPYTVRYALGAEVQL